jgi:hypothetical protein
MVKPLQCHGEAREVSNDGPKGAQQVAPEHHLIALQGNDEEVDAEQLVVDGEG